MRFSFSLTQKRPSGFEINKAPNRKLNVAIGFMVSILILATATASAQLWSRKHKRAVIPFVASGQTSSITTKGEKPSTTVGLPIQLKKLGFVPREITRPAGDYQLSVSNQSGVSEIRLSLEFEHGAILHEAQVKRERLRWRQNVRLIPGIYRLTEASHPDWVCRIVITSK